MSNFNASATGNTVTYNAYDGFDQIVRSATYHHLTINMPLNMTATLGGMIVANGDITISNGILDVSSGNNYGIIIKGSWLNTGSFTPRNGTVTFNGLSDQYIIGDTDWYNLVITGG